MTNLSVNSSFVFCLPYSPKLKKKSLMTFWSLSVKWIVLKNTSLGLNGLFYRKIFYWKTFCIAFYVYIVLYYTHIRYTEYKENRRPSTIEPTHAQIACQRQSNYVANPSTSCRRTNYFGSFARRCPMNKYWRHTWPKYALLFILEIFLYLYPHLSNYVSYIWYKYNSTRLRHRLFLF